MREVYEGLKNVLAAAISEDSKWEDVLGRVVERDTDGERKKFRKGGERNLLKFFFSFSTSLYTSTKRRVRTKMLNFLEYETSDEKVFWVFGVPMLKN